jgi:leucyl aminopeptidase
MKLLRSLIVSLLAMLVLNGCKKQDPAELQKEQTILKLTGSINADSVRLFDTWLQGMGTRFALATNNRTVANAIKNRFISFGYNDAVLDSFTISKVWRDSTYMKTEYNVIATIVGSSEPDSVSIMGAHFDDITGTGDPLTIAPGANDNGSGVSAVLEVARVMKLHSFAPKATIRFIAFAAEEQGLLGSSWYARKLLFNGEKIRFMLNNDMIAHQTGTDKLAWYVDIMDYSNSVSLRKEAENSCFRFSVLKPYNDNTYSHYSDSYSFYAQGYKALFFFAQEPDPWYHTISDQLSNCNFEYCSEVAKLNCAILVTKN